MLQLQRQLLVVARPRLLVNLRSLLLVILRQMLFDLLTHIIPPFATKAEETERNKVSDARSRVSVGRSGGLVGSAMMAVSGGCWSSSKSRAC